MRRQGRVCQVRDRGRGRGRGRVRGRGRGRGRGRVRAGNRHLLERGDAHVNVYREAKVLDDCAQLLRRDLAALVRSTTQRDERVHCGAAQPERVSDHSTGDGPCGRYAVCGVARLHQCRSHHPCPPSWSSARRSPSETQRSLPNGNTARVRQRPRQRCLMRRTDLSTSI